MVGMVGPVIINTVTFLGSMAEEEKDVVNSTSLMTGIVSLLVTTQLQDRLSKGQPTVNTSSLCHLQSGPRKADEQSGFTMIMTIRQREKHEKTDRDGDEHQTITRSSFEAWLCLLALGVHARDVNGKLL